MLHWLALDLGERTKRVASQRPIVLDASAALVLFASERIQDIVRAQPVSVFVVQETITEVRFLRGAKSSSPSTEKEEIDWSELLTSGLISILERTDAQEFAEFVRLAQSVDDGEAAAAAA